MNDLIKLLSIKKPIIQAPMAGGAVTPSLASAVSSAGGLGSLASGYLHPDAVETQLLEMKQQTDRPFQVNLFVPKEEEAPSGEQVQRWKELIPHANRARPFTSIQEEWQDFYQKVDLLVEHRVRICSFTFDLPPEDAVKKLKDVGCILLGTACSPEEALLMEERGMDAVVLQGKEAGGHQGAFLPASKPVELRALITETADRIGIPVIAAGGITDEKDVRKALALGAQCVQVGTAFLVCKESAAHHVHKQKIFTASASDTRLTKVFSGKEARGIVNAWMEENKHREQDVLPYPYLNTLTKPMRQEAATRNDPSHMSLWAGQGAGRLSKEMNVKELMEKLWNSKGT
ncbi:nitronate monooxygenase [[Bacillus] enclensis]|uniref:Probable nitronate monooxygenase n=1 Tax=[Bacillus] enclensis TaxID=1402860 RepID=A0A0V8H739_9BACI|nr:nitronate monooxygenase [[Bacillus] enclensis]KSU58313.1 nitronate monooxygenase [[Bacillus] enclensis]SCC33875.1 nitronate monooxygenase [[Bacillus] enclensis]